MWIIRRQLMLHSTSQLLSHSRIKTLTDCQRRYFLQYIMGLRPKDQNVDRLEAGRIMHDALDHLYRTGEVVELAEWEATGRDAPWLNHHHLQAILHKYASDVFPDDRERWEVIEIEGQASIEGEWTVRLLPDDDFEIIVRPDLVVYDVEDEVYRVVDHKFTFSYIRKEIAMLTQVGLQLKLYVLGVHALTPLPVWGGITNTIYGGEHATNPNSKARKHERYIADFTQDQLREAHQQIATAAGNMQLMDAFAEGGATYEDVPASYGYACSFCPYLQI
ncbi:MAG: PD-(D/E)XK nuclease family protein, partial [Saprospiraceae bacterium]|nr:PD-(D/E)XK nuclease family protein [Saprospiraceae bacterium]